MVKEPETIAWLDRTLAPGSVLYDIGANIGLYALYAAKRHPGAVTVYCFEPEPLNCARLNRNIALNSMSGTVLAFPVGLGAADALTTLRLSRLQSGAALHGERMVAAGAEAHIAGLVVRSLDSLLADGTALAWPTHLKIDVDGPELEILRGAEATLRDPRLRHVLVELETTAIDGVAETMKVAGFEIAARGEPVNDMCNVIFEKPA